MRRSTLGPLSSLDLNSSLDTSMQVDEYNPKKSIGGSVPGSRLSLSRAPWNSNKSINGRGASNLNDSRRMSIMRATIQNGANGLGPSILAPSIRSEMTDPRPIQTAAWRGDAINKIMEFLMATEYPQRCSPKLLASPSSKDFQAILTHMTRCLDGGYVMVGKLEDEVGSLIKALHYPFTPSKTAISTVGASHSWPTLLAFLAWMVELLRYHWSLSQRQNEEEQSAGGTGHPSAVGTGEYFWWYLRTAYAHFLSGDDQAVEKLEEEIQQAFVASYGAVKNEVTALEEQYKHAEVELQKVKETRQHLPMVQQQARDLAADVEKLRIRLAEQEEYSLGLQMKLQEKQAEVAQSQQHLNNVVSELDQLRNRVHTQSLTSEQAQQLHARTTTLKATLAATRSSRNMENERFQQKTQELRKGLEQLQNAVQTYTNKAREVQVLPLGAKFSFGVDYSLRIQPEIALALCSNPEYGLKDECNYRFVSHMLLSNDMKHNVKGKIKILRSNLSTQALEARAKLVEINDAISSAHERKAALSRSISEAEATCTALDVRCRQEAEHAEKRIADITAIRVREESVREEKRHAAEKAASRAQERTPAVLRQTSAAIDLLEANQAAERQRLIDLVAKAVLRVSEHKQLLRSRLDSLAAGTITEKNRVRTHANEWVYRLQSEAKKPSPLVNLNQHIPFPSAQFSSSETMTNSSQFMQHGHSFANASIASQRSEAMDIHQRSFEASARSTFVSNQPGPSDAMYSSMNQSLNQSLHNNHMLDQSMNQSLNSSYNNTTSMSIISTVHPVSSFPTTSFPSKPRLSAGIGPVSSTRNSIATAYRQSLLSHQLKSL